MSIWNKVATGVKNDFKAAGRVVTLRRSGPNPAIQPTDTPIWTWRESFAGIRVTEDVALSVPAVWSAVTLISSAIAGLPIDVYQAILGAKIPMETPETKLLSLQPNPEMTAMAFWERLVFHEVLWGNAYIFVVKNAAGRPLELWPIEPDRVEVGRSAGGIKYYEVDGTRSDRRVMIDYFQGGEVIHVANLGIDGLAGMSPIDKLSESIALSKASEEYSARFFSQDSTPAGIISVPSVVQVSREQLRAIAADWEQNHLGGKGAHRTSALGNGATYQQISVNPEDSQLLEQRRFQVAEIARIFRVPPHLIADVERSTSWGSGIEEQARNFVEFSLNPHILRFEHAINVNFLRRVETDRYMKFNVGGLLRADTLKRYQTYAIALDKRIMVPNEARGFEDMVPLEGGDEPLAAPVPAVVPATAGPVDDDDL